MSLRAPSALGYARSALHAEERVFPETNCYVDLWIELLHSQGFDPRAGLAFTLATGFEGDQWLFFKQPTRDLEELYGVDVQELNVYRPLLEHAAEQLARGRLLMVELDAHYLPDTRGVTYREGHAKTTIGIAALDRAGEQLGYFHNAGYFELGGADFRGLFGLDRAASRDALPPYCELVKLGPAPAQSAVPELARAQLSRHLRRCPRENPVTAFRARFLSDVARLREEDGDAFHLYAFATLRQCGAAAELGASFLEFLEEHGEPSLEAPRAQLLTLSSQAKSLQFRAARAVMARREVDFTPQLDAMERAWHAAQEALSARYLR